MTSTNMSWVLVAVLAVSTGLLPQMPIQASPIMEAAVSREFDNTIVSTAGSKINNPVNEPSTPLVRCYCNMPACLAASGGVQTCTTRLGCFSQLRPNLPNLDGTVTSPVTTTTSTTTKKSTIPEELDVEAAIYANDNALNGAYGCLDFFLNKTCNEVLKLMETEESEFPSMQTESSSQTSVVSAYHCCQEDMCNDRSHVAATASNAEAALIAAFRSTMFQKDDSLKKQEPITTDTPSMLPIAAALVDNHGWLYADEVNVFPSAVSGLTTPDTITSASVVKTTNSVVESTNTEIPTDIMTKSVVIDTNISTKISPTPTESNLVLNTSNKYVSALDINVTPTEATTILPTNITANETTYVFDPINTSSEATSVSNANSTSTKDILTVNTIIKSMDNATVIKSTATEDTEVTEKIFVNEKISNVNSINNTKSPIDKDVNITAEVVKLIDTTDAVATSTIETPTTLMPKVSEVIMVETTSTSPSAIVKKNTTEVMSSTTESFLDDTHVPHEFPMALALHRSADDETTSDVTSKEAGLSGIKSANQVNDSHSPMDPWETSHDVAHQKSTDDVTPPPTGVLGLTGIPQWVEGVTGVLAICGVIGVTLAALAAIKVIRKTDVFENYKSVCSNPGQPCACGDGRLGSRRSRQLTSSPGVYRKTTGPALPPPNKPNKNLYGLTYIDNTGNSTHVYTPIPVPQ